MRLRHGLISSLAALAVLTSATATATIRATPELLDAPTGGTPEIATDGAMELVSNVPYTGGSDLEFATIDERDYVFAGRVNGYGPGGSDMPWVKVVDVTDPTQPVVVSEVKCALYQNDVQLFNHPDGRITLVLAQDNAYQGVCELPSGSRISVPPGFVTVDVTDPAAPRLLGWARIRRGAHNVTVHPTEPVVYVSNSGLGEAAAQIHIWDISNPSRPSRVKDWTYLPVSSPHDITFNTSDIARPDGSVTPVGDRAYAASISHTDILDTSDPRNPVLISTINHPEIQISHQSDPTPDGEYLLVSDEVGGGSAAPVCPGGGVHIWKIGPEAAFELAPVKVGVFWADPVGPALNPTSCTAHVFRINPDSRTMAIAWYTAGVHVIDFGDLLKGGALGSGATLGVGARTIGAAKMSYADTWAAKMWPDRHPGYVFANDIYRGLDIFYLPACDPAC